MRELGTGSELHRIVRCPASAVLPRVNTESEEASAGQVLHGFLSAVSSVGRDAALAAVPVEHQPAAEVIPVDRLPVDPSRFRSEVTFAYDLDTGAARELGQHLGRDYSRARDNEVPTTLDVQGVDGELALYADYKTGWRQLVPAAENMQIRFGVFVAARALGLPRGRGALIRIRADREPIYDEADFGPFEFAEIEDELRHARAGVAAQSARLAAGKPVEVTTGSHCTYCPAKPHCPAYQQLVVRMATSVGDVTTEVRSEITPALAARAYRNFRMAQDALKLVGEALYAYALTNPIDLGGGLVWGPIEGSRKDLDGNKAFAVVERLFGREIADRAVEREATQASIKRALAVVRDSSTEKKKPAVTKMLDQVLAELEQAGGIKHTPTTKVDEHRPKAKEIPGATPEGAPAAGDVA